MPGIEGGRERKYGAALPCSESQIHIAHQCTQNARLAVSEHRVPMYSVHSPCSACCHLARVDAAMLPCRHVGTVLHARRACRTHQIPDNGLCYFFDLFVPFLTFAYNETRKQGKERQGTKRKGVRWGAGSMCGSTGARRRRKWCHFWPGHARVWGQWSERA